VFYACEIILLGVVVCYVFRGANKFVYKVLVKEISTYDYNYLFKYHVMY